MHARLILFAFGLFLQTARCEVEDFKSVRFQKMYFYDKTVKLNYNDAKKYCREKFEGRPVELRSGEETDFVIDEIEPDHYFHLGVVSANDWPLLPKYFLVSRM